MRRVGDLGSTEHHARHLLHATLFFVAGLASAAPASSDPHESVSIQLSQPAVAELAAFAGSTPFGGSGGGAEPGDRALYGAAAFSGVGVTEDAALLAEGAEIVGTDNRISGAELEYLRSLPAVGGHPGQEVLLGPDTRMRLYTRPYPARAVVLIVFNGGRCTGFMIGPNTVATAGHCVHSGGSRGSWNANVRVFPGFDYDVAPYGGCAATRLFSVQAWVTNADERYDYAAIKLGCTIGNTTGWFGFRANAGLNTPAIITGYPGDKSLTMWQSSDRVRLAGAKQLFYPNDTVGGMSGSPVWEDLWLNNRSFGSYAVAIHAYGTHGTGPHRVYNHGTRIDTAVFNNLKAWKNAN